MDIVAESGQYWLLTRERILLWLIMKKHTLRPVHFLPIL